jgi:hypothetical protein
MIAVMDTLLERLYPQLRTVEIFVEISAVRDRISEIPESRVRASYTSD